MPDKMVSCMIVSLKLAFIKWEMYSDTEALIIITVSEQTTIQMGEESENQTTWFIALVVYSLQKTFAAIFFFALEMAIPLLRIRNAIYFWSSYSYQMNLSTSNADNENKNSVLKWRLLSNFWKTMYIEVEVSSIFLSRLKN